MQAYQDHISPLPPQPRPLLPVDGCGNVRRPSRQRCGRTATHACLSPPVQQPCIEMEKKTNHSVLTVWRQLSFCLSIYLSICIYLSIYLYVCLSIYSSVYLSIHLSIRHTILEPVQESISFNQGVHQPSLHEKVHITEYHVNMHATEQNRTMENIEQLCSTSSLQCLISTNCISLARAWRPPPAGT